MPSLRCTLVPRRLGGCHNGREIVELVPHGPHDLPNAAERFAGKRWYPHLFGDWSQPSSQDVILIDRCSHLRHEDEVIGAYETLSAFKL